MNMNPMVHCQLWMGNLEPNMTESFIMSAFHKMGENPTSVKVMRNKYTGEPAGYCFVHFPSDDMAVDAMHKLNGKPIPGTNPVVRFRLNNAGRENRSGPGGNEEREFSVWVGDLSSDVDDYSLYRVFSQKYTSIKTAKVILDNSGFSKGYGFVRFGSEEEQKHALWSMNGYSGLGSKLLKICTAAPKTKSGSSSQPGQQYPVSTEYSQTSQQYYDPSAYWQNYSAAWSGYYGSTATDANAMQTQTDQTAPQSSHSNTQPTQQQDHSMSLVEHKVPLDVEAMNKQSIDQERSLWEGIDASRWLPSDVMEIY